MLPRQFNRSFICLSLGILFIVSGGLLAYFWPTIFKFIVATSLKLSPGSTSYKMWKDTPVPMYIDFYLFNWTNPEDLKVEGKKPILQELGPYRFKELKFKNNVTWNDNFTITFKQEHKWFYDPDNSNGSLDDLVTTLNVIALTSAYVSRDWNIFLVFPLSEVLKRETIAITRNVSQLLFEGYNDALISMGKMGSVFSKNLEVPYDKFGWMYTRNGSQDFDGVFNMATGADSISKVGVLEQWNYKNTTKFFTGTCSNVNGSAGELFPPHRTKGDSIEIYSSDLCRSISFDYSEEMVVEDITGFRYTAGHSVVDNGTLDESNKCFCGGECVPAGVMNVSTCRFGAPAFVSYPHFHLADPYYLNQVDGLNPDAEKHTFAITIEPVTGIPLDVRARFQINVLMQPYKSLTLLKDVPKIFFPMIWFEQSASITPELAASLKQLLMLPTLGTIGATVIIFVGIFLCAYVPIVHWCQNRNFSKNNKQTERIANYSDAVSPLVSRTSDPIVDTVYYDAGCEKMIKNPNKIVIQKQRI